MRPLQVFLPLKRRGASGLERFEAGDRVRVTGVASQYCLIPPFNRYFEVMIGSADAVLLLEKRWFISPRVVAGLLIALGVALAGWWLRERRMGAQRRTMKALYGLGEEIIGAASPPDILRTLGAALPDLLKITGVRIHLYNRGSKSLESVVRPGRAKPARVPAGAEACFRNQALLTIPDARRSPLVNAKGFTAPRSVMFVPMLAHTELLGVLELYDDRRAREFSPDEQVMAQHLANQVALAVRLMEEESIREQLFRSERLAAAGQLISGIAGELRAPLESIGALAEGISFQPDGDSPSERLTAIGAEAEKASDIVARLLSFARSDAVEARPLDLCALLRGLIELRRPGWQARAFQVQASFPPGPVAVLGSQRQLERVFLNLLIHAEEAAAGGLGQGLTIDISVLARRVLVDFSYERGAARNDDPGDDSASEGLMNEGVCRGIVRSHGGDIRVTGGADPECRIELELPVASPQAEAGISARLEEALSARPLTTMAVEPDDADRASLVAALGRRGCRVVPVRSAEEATELAERLPFDLVFCSVRLPGLNWLELFERVRHQAAGFVLLTEGFDAELSRSFPDEDGSILAKPVSEAELDRVLLAAASRPVVPEHH
jgi:signal transduction histidine kinase